MIGWKPRPFIFIHVPKCAGTSIEKALLPAATGRRDFVDCSDVERTGYWLPGKQGLQHSKLAKYQRHFPLAEYFTFAFVRNPWDRAVSQIEYLKSKTGDDVFRGTDVKEHIKIYCQTKRTVWAHDLGACQVDYIRDRKGVAGVDFVGRFETLVDDFVRVSKLLGFRDIPTLPHIFRSGRTRHYSEYYDHESTTWIRRRFARDVEFFGYSFE